MLVEDRKCVPYSVLHVKAGWSGVVVCVEVGVVVVVNVVDTLVVGVVTSHCWKPPAANASVIWFIVSATRLHSSESIK